MGRAWGYSRLAFVFAQVSVLEVKELCKAIGHCAKLPEVDHEEKRQQVTQLLKGLLPAYYPDSPSKTPDSRPLERYYAQIVPACTSNFVGTVLRQEVPPLMGSLPWHGWCGIIILWYVDWQSKRLCNLGSTSKKIQRIKIPTRYALTVYQACFNPYHQVRVRNAASRLLCHSLRGF